MVDSGESLAARPAPARPWRDAVAAPSAAAIVVAAAVALYAAVFAGAAVVRHLAFDSARFDLGNMVQAVWSTAHGRLLETTDVGGEQISRLGSHVDPLLALLAPLWLAWPSPLALLVLQAVAVSLGAIPVYLLARRHLASARAAAFFAVAYLLYPATQWNAFTPVSGFHAASLALPLILTALLFLDRDRLLPFTVFALLAASTKEHMPLAVGCLGLWYAVERGRRGVGAAILGTGLGLTLLNFLVVLPAYSPSGGHALTYRYEEFGSTPVDIVVGALTSPGAVVSTAFTAHKLAYLGLLFVPFLGLWLRAPLLLVGAVPELVTGLLSSDPNQTSIAFHYSAGIAPFVVAASVLGASRLRFDSRRVAVYVLAAVGLTAGYSPLILGADSLGRLRSEDGLLAARREAVALVPAGASVSATNALGAHLSERRRILVYPRVDGADWIVVDTEDTGYLATGGPTRRQFAALRRDPRYVVAYDRAGVLALRRAGP